METICAISTPYGSGGIAVVRVSGEDAIRITDSLFVGRQRLTDALPNSLHCGHIEKDGEVLDQVVVSIFRAPHSFTGEDVAEISCHGSLYIQQELIHRLIEAGCRAARAGEFTQRAFLNGKMDLTEAEAVADLIASTSKAEKDLALSQLRGSIGKELKELRDRLLHITSLLELELDFADHEELEFADRHELSQLADEIACRLRQLTQSFQTGNAIRNGVPVAIIGATNAGKSTLLNALVGEDRAIVSDIQGTTRDTIEDTLHIGGMLFRLTDTAGLRETEDDIERMGIARSRQAAQQAQIIIQVIDAAAPNTHIDIPLSDSQTLIQVWNKADLLPKDATTNADTPNRIYLSAKYGNTDKLKQLLLETAGTRMETGAVTISNARHYEALTRALGAIERVQEGLRDNLSGELVSMDLQDCLHAMGEVTGEITSQEVLSSIFSRFCIGK